MFARKICGCSLFAALPISAGPAAAQSLPQITATASMGTAEALDGRERQYRAPLGGDRSTTAERTQSETQLTVVRGGAVTGLSTDSGAQTGRVSLAAVVDGAQVVASRGADIVGRPMDIFRPTGAGSNLSIRFPSRMPVAARAVTSGFGWRTHPILGGRRAHSGVDLAAPHGSPVVATADGIVGEANWRGGYGLFVAIDSGGVETRYGHMSRLNVVAGQRVRQGDVIGYVGSTGRSTGPHLHYEVRVNGQAVDPLRARAK